MTTRRGLILSSLGMVVAAPALARAAPLVQMRGLNYAIDGILPLDNWMYDVRARVPAVRLTFPDGSSTGWFRYDLACVTGTGHVKRAPANAVEVSLWAPNGMRAISRIPIT